MNSDVARSVAWLRCFRVFSVIADSAFEFIMTDVKQQSYVMEDNNIRGRRAYNREAGRSFRGGVIGGARSLREGEKGCKYSG